MVARDEELPCTFFEYLQNAMVGRFRIKETIFVAQTTPVCLCSLATSGSTRKFATHLASSRQDTTAHCSRHRYYLYDSTTHGWGVTDGVEVQCNMRRAERG